MMLIDKVRAATYDLHQSLDQSLIPCIEAIQSKEQYATLLMMFFGFFKPVYDKISANIDIHFLPDYSIRRKPEWILNDMKVLGVDHTIHLCKQVPEINNNAAAFGALYVLEGSTLGGIVIRKMIHDKLHIEEGFTFFSGYGRQTRERWNVFIHSLNNLDKHNIADEMVIQTASATFTFFKEWLHHSRLTVNTFLQTNTPAAY